jgi:hypothetical protein
MYKIAADRTDKDGNITESRNETVDSFATTIATGGKSAYVELTMSTGLHIVFNVGSKASDYQYVRIFKHDGTLIESVTYANDVVFHSREHTAQRP